MLGFWFVCIANSTVELREEWCFFHRGGVIGKIGKLYCTTLPMESMVGCTVVDSGESRSPVARHIVGNERVKRLLLGNAAAREFNPTYLIRTFLCIGNFYFFLHI